MSNKVMGKFFLLVCFFFHGLFVWAWDDDAAVVMGYGMWEIEGDTRILPPARERFSFNNRRVELSMQMGVHASNSFISYSDFFLNPFRILRNLIAADSFADFQNNPSLYYRDQVSINIDDLFRGFRLNFGFDAAPFSLNINMRDEWGFGLDIAHVTATGNLLIPEAVLGFHETTGELFGAGGAVFVDIGIPVFFHTRGFRISVRPAAYLPLVYVRPGFSYSFGPSHEGGGLGQRFEVSYDVRVFSPFSLEGLLGNSNGNTMEDIMQDPLGMVARNLGYDITLGIEYPLNSLVSVGVNIVNIPFPFLWATLDNYTRLQGNMFFDTSYVNFGDAFGGGFELPEGAFGYSIEDPYFGTLSRGQRILRPFTMLFFANYRPFGTQTVTLIPSLGFSINQLYTRIAALEGGLSARFDLANIFITTIGMNYNDRRWRHSMDLAFNFRVLELGIGVSMQSPNFVKSFQGAGLGVNFGIKMGW